MTWKLEPVPAGTKVPWWMLPVPEDSFSGEETWNTTLNASSR